MDSQKHPGDPKTTYLYNLGGQHDHLRYNTIVAFVGAIRKLYVEGNNLLAYTNNLQQVERGYFEKLGFTAVVDPSVQRMQTHYADAEVVSKFLNNDFFVTMELEAKRLKEQAAEAKKKLAEERRIQQEAKRLARLNGTARNLDGSIPRKRGEFRVGDTVRTYRVPAPLGSGRRIEWKYNGIVETLNADGTITISGHTIRPMVNNGWNDPNVYRT